MGHGPRRGKCEVNGFYSNHIKNTDLGLDGWVQRCLCFHSNTQYLVWLYMGHSEDGKLEIVLSGD